MKYCENCGNPLDEKDEFCSCCGKKIRKPENEIEWAHTQKNHVPIEVYNSRWDTFCCQMAYFGTMFWMPIIFTHKSRRAWFCANQGLWTLILAIGSMEAMKLIRWIRWKSIGGIVGVIGGGIYSLVFMLLILFMLYLAAHCISSVRALQKGKDPEVFLFFEDKPIIRYKE